MIKMTLSEYLRVPKNYRGVWTNERWDIPNWAYIREKHLGKHTLMTNINGGTCLKFFTERGFEPHYADCLIRYKDNYDTVEVRIAIGMDSDTEKDDDIFFYCDTLEDMKSLAEIGSEDFYIADCYSFGVYEDLL